MSTAEVKATNFVENGFVRLGTMISIFLFCFGAVWQATEFIKNDALWKQDMASKMKLQTERAKTDSDRVFALQESYGELQKQLREITERTEERWRKGEMRGWIERTKKINPDWKPASVDVY